MGLPGDLLQFPEDPGPIHSLRRSRIAAAEQVQSATGAYWQPNRRT
jgi:hypothetical protein